MLNFQNLEIIYNKTGFLANLGEHLKGPLFYCEITFQKLNIIAIVFCI